MKTILQLPLGLLALAFWLWPAQSGLAGFDGFLNIPGIPGESADKDHKDWIMIESFSWGATQSGTLSLTNRPQFQGFTVTKVLDKASPKLMLACMGATNLPQVNVELRYPGGTNSVVFLVIKLTDVMISSYTGGGGSGDLSLPLEQMTLNFSGINIQYQAVDATGAPSGSPVTATWNWNQTPALVR